jgi:hypothetical protein
MEFEDRPEDGVASVPAAGDLEGVARDATTLLDVIGAYEQEGFDAQFLVRDGAQLECAVCRARFGAGDADAVALRRLEGASDPDDMLAVAALGCPSCKARGTVVLGYGPTASAEDAAILETIDPPRGPAAAGN